MDGNDTRGRGVGDRAPRTLEERREAKRLARQNRKAQMRMQGRAEAAPVPAGREQRGRPGGRTASASSPVGPLARRFGRIGANMVLKQIVKALLSAVLRR